MEKRQVGRTRLMIDALGTSVSAPVTCGLGGKMGFGFASDSIAS